MVCEPDAPLSAVEMAVMDAALAEEMVEFLGLDDPAFLRRYRATRAAGRRWPAASVGVPGPPALG